MSATVAPSVSLSLSCDGSRRIVDAAASADSDGSTGYGRDFDGGTSDTGTTAEHVYRQPGRYTVKPTVTDDNGATGSAWTAIARTRLTARAYKLTRPQKTGLVRVRRTTAIVALGVMSAVLVGAAGSLPELALALLRDRRRGDRRRPFHDRDRRSARQGRLAGHSAAREGVMTSSEGAPSAVASADERPKGESSCDQ